MSGDHNKYCSANKIEAQDLTLQMQQEELHANAARYELMRDMKLNEMMQLRCLPVPIEEAYDWFDAMIDEKIRAVYPNATIGEVK